MSAPAAGGRMTLPRFHHFREADAKKILRNAAERANKLACGSEEWRVIPP